MKLLNLSLRELFHVPPCPSQEASSRKVKIPSWRPQARVQAVSARRPYHQNLDKSPTDVPRHAMPQEMLPQPALNHQNPAPTRAATTPSRIPKFSQNHKGLKQYYDKANETFESLSITDSEIEYEFVHAFISGLATKGARGKVTQALTAVHRVRNRLDGGVTIMCAWEEVAAGLKRAGSRYHWSERRDQKEEEDVEPSNSA